MDEEKKETYLQKQLKLRDIKKVLKAIRSKLDAEGVIDDLESFIDEQLIGVILEEIKMEEAYKVLLKIVVNKVKDLLTEEED